ncbi:MAG: CAP domain-containing protein [Chthoniobacterales bacterium]
MRPLRTFVVFAAIFTAGFVSEAKAEAAPASDVVREMNLARQQPILYAKFLEEQRAGYRGPEGTRALEEAIRFLRSASPRQPLTASPGMSRAAVDHCAEQAGGGMSHRGRFGSSPGDRLNRYGTWGGHWGENLSCGRGSAREVVIGLIIDDGQPARKHRANIFNPAFNFAGAAMGSHAQFRTICSMEFAATYAERGQPTADPLFARN